VHPVGSYCTDALLQWVLY